MCLYISLTEAKVHDVRKGELDTKLEVKSRVLQY